MFAIKGKGTSKVPDFVQIRDKNFALIEHIKLSSLEKRISEIFPENYQNIYDKISASDFDTIIDLD